MDKFKEPAPAMWQTQVQNWISREPGTLPKAPQILSGPSGGHLNLGPSARPVFLATEQSSTAPSSPFPSPQQLSQTSLLSQAPSPQLCLHRRETSVFCTQTPKYCFLNYLTSFSLPKKGHWLRGARLWSSETLTHLVNLRPLPVSLEISEVPDRITFLVSP